MLSNNGFAGIDLMTGPPSIEFKLREELVPARRQNCQDKVPGAVVVMTVKPGAESFSGEFAFRVRYRTTDGDKQSTHRYKISIFP